MLGDGELFANVAVRDLVAGKDFYGATLGLKQIDENPAAVTYRASAGQLFMYQSDTAGSGQATCVTWVVRDVAATVAQLKSKGINFEHYDIPQAKREGDVHIMGPMTAAWFKDPDGNILSVVSGG